MGEEKINRWFQSNDRKQIIDELNEIEILQNSLQRTLHEWERHGKTVDEWKYQYGEYWERLFIRREFLEMVIQRGDAGEYVSRYFENAASHNVNSTDEQNKDAELRSAHVVIKRLRARTKYNGMPSRDVLEKLADKHRYESSKKLNFTKIGEELGVSRYKAEKWMRGIE